MRETRRDKVMDAARERLEAGLRPTFKELGAATGMSAVGAWKHVQSLIGEGKFVRTRDGFDLPGRTDLSTVPSEQLRGELARRGLTLDALEEPPRPLFDKGRVCAANHCLERVQRGHLMCRRHWLRLPIQIRRAITNAWAARHMQAFQEAVEAARNELGGFTTVVERVQ